MKPSAAMLIAVLAALAVAVAGCSSGNGKGGVSDANAGAGSGADAEGSLLAGSESGAKYYEYSEAAYRNALDEGKVVYLEFHATWCPICREQEPHIFSAFNSLDNPGVVGFRVNYDTETALKREFNVAYQHTRVIIKDGKVVKKASDFWNSDRIRSELEKAAAGAAG